MKVKEVWRPPTGLNMPLSLGATAKPVYLVQDLRVQWVWSDWGAGRVANPATQ